MVDIIKLSSSSSSFCSVLPSPSTGLNIFLRSPPCLPAVMCNSKDIFSVIGFIASIAHPYMCSRWRSFVSRPLIFSQAVCVPLSVLFNLCPWVLAESEYSLFLICSLPSALYYCCRPLFRSAVSVQCFLNSYNKFYSSFYSVFEFLISVFIQFQFSN